MSALVNVIDGVLPWVRSKAKVTTRKAPVVIRIYSGPRVVVKKSVRVKVTRVGRAKLLVGPHGCRISHASFDGKWMMTRVSFSFDMPVLRDFEMFVPDWPQQMCPDRGQLILCPTNGFLICLTNSGWG